MHLKNWSLIYYGKGNKPALAPVYDVLDSPLHSVGHHGTVDGR